MKKLMIGVLVALFAVTVTAVAWDDANRTVSKLGVEVIENPAGSTVTVSDTLSVTNGIVLPIVSQTVTNGQTVTIQYGKINILTGSGMADTLSNTNILALPGATDVGKQAYIAVAFGSTNAIAISKTTAFRGDAVTLGAGDSMNVFVVSTNAVYGK